MMMSDSWKSDFKSRLAKIYEILIFGLLLSSSAQDFDTKVFKN
jgi:hypothetical protein